MAILFSKEFNISKENIIRTGVFDVLIDEDSHFFINIKRLQATNISEFVGAYEKVNEYFRQIGILLKAATPEDKLYRSALAKFDFPEVKGINLGFSSSSHGAGFGKQLRNQIMKDAYEIIRSGSEQPEIFHLTSLFEENVGPDRLSDMVARIIYNNIVSYTKRVNTELGITPEKYPQYQFFNGIVCNPYKQGMELLLLPADILHELPIARCWDDIDRVCRENQAIRNEINEIVSSEWSKMASSQKKKYLRDYIFMNPERLTHIIDSYRETTVKPFDVFSNIDYLIGFLKSTLNSIDDQLTSFDASKKILENYQEWIEYHRGSLIINNSDTKSAEKVVQRTIHACALMFCKEHNWDISPEEDGGRGPVDFKISRGNDKTVIEIKLTSNQQCVHGLSTQIEEYALAENTKNKIFVIVDTGNHSERVQNVLEKRKELINAGKETAHIIVIDAKPKKSASQY